MTSEQQPTTGVTREVELLWGLREGGRRGPKPKLSRAAIVDAAIALADTEGLDAVSMQRVAERLGYTTMSLYRHVDSKDDLVTLMWDVAMSEHPPGPRTDGDWRAGIEAWCQGVVDQYREHPWYVHISKFGPPAGPNGLRWMEAGLRELNASGLTPAESLQILLLLNTTLHNVLRMDHDRKLAAQKSGVPLEESEREWLAGLRRVLDPQEFPTITGTIDAGTFEEGPPDADLPEGLHFPVQRILDGVEAYVRARGGAPSAGRPR
ncbi:TetR/AcrR family transcriptional regulator [Nocardiopsis ganjiahuensis]|uniref:TetR/AcrR family transcriptional regulator n=1 Tax=Nocardiopsis ganjiahuensis TaxID=239984 RepID=UPI0003457A99|nr:TetR/AcrR family transcriptional regulator [Nocardiopsis ganjiahuensis]